MFPTFRHRLILSAAVLLGALAWLSVRGPLTAPDGAGGITLTGARVGLPTAVAMVVLAGLPALALGVVAAVTGNPLSGVFAACLSLFGLAIAGGPIDGLLRREQSAAAWPGAGLLAWRPLLPPPAAYASLIAEVVLWFGGLAILLAITQFLRSPIRTRCPALAFTDHLGMDTLLRFPQLQALLAGLTSALVGGILAFFLLRNTSNGQVIGGLLIAFTIGGLAGQMAFPQTNPVAILLSPAAVAIVGYSWVLLSYQTQAQVLKDWYAQRLPGLALALPIHYVGAAVAGCALGIGWAQGLMVGEEEPGAGGEPASEA